MVDWSGLPSELLICVAEHIEKLEDFIAFGAVCKGWHAAGKKEYFKGLWLRQGTPYMMIRDNDDNEDVTCKFYSLVEYKVAASIRISKSKIKRCHESLGWLLAIDEDGSMCLLNPFSSTEIPLPTRIFHEFDQYNIDEHVDVKKMVLSARPNETSDFILMTICRGCGSLAFWTPGDQSWNIIKNPREVRDVVYHGGHFYALSGGSIWDFTIERHNQPMCQIVSRLVDAANNRRDRYMKHFNILKTSQSLFIISRITPWYIEQDYYFQVYEVDLSAGTWVQINNIGNMAFFIGHNATFAVDTSRFSGNIKGNQIYFTQDGWDYFYFEQRVMPKTWGEYNIETGKIEMFYPGRMRLNNAYSPIWITPCF